jgi:WD40 repeat protein
MTGHTGRVRALALLNNGQLASGAQDRTIRIWDPNTGALISTLSASAQVFSLVVLQNSNLASGLSTGEIQVWDISSGTSLFIFDTGSAGTMAMTVLASGELVNAYSSGSLYFLKIWNSLTGTLIRQFASSSSMNDLTQLPNSNIATGNGDNSIKIYDSSNGALLQTIINNTAAVNTIALIPDGRLASGSRDGSLKILVV